MKSVLQAMACLIILGALGYFFHKHSGWFPFDHNPMQYMPNMHHTKSLIPQRGYDFFEDGAGVRVPPQGTLSVGQTVYPFTKETPAANVPRTGNKFPVSRDVVLRGQKMFNTYCIVCHGPTGLGNGLVVPPFPQPPSLQSEKVRGYADSQIFHVITVGQNTMNSYAPQIREDDRWAIIHYVRVLHKVEKPSAEDLKALDEFLKPKGVK